MSPEVTFMGVLLCLWLLQSCFWANLVSRPRRLREQAFDRFVYRHRVKWVLDHGELVWSP